MYSRISLCKPRTTASPRLSVFTPTKDARATNQLPFEFKELYNNDLSLIPEEKLRERWNLNAPTEEEISNLYSDSKVDNSDLEVYRYDDIDFAKEREMLVAQAKEIHDSGDFGIMEEPHDMVTAVVELAVQTNHVIYLTNGRNIGNSPDEYSKDRPLSAAL